MQNIKVNLKFHKKISNVMQKLLFYINYLIVCKIFIHTKFFLRKNAQ